MNEQPVSHGQQPGLRAACCRSNLELLLCSKGELAKLIDIETLLAGKY